ncbi:MAG: CoA transferase, partial [Chloroflexota bacterium]|nr:CoA transferase [Chloroflexota bacterium]
GYVTLATGEGHHWRALVELMGNPQWAEDERFKDRASRTQNAQALFPLIEEWTEQHTKDEIITPSQAKGVPSLPINTIADVVNSPHLAARGFFVDIDHPEAGTARYPGPPHKFSSIPWRIERPAPLLGQHNEEVYSGRLGYSKQELVKLRETRVI